MFPVLQKQQASRDVLVDILTLFLSLARLLVLLLLFFLHFTAMRCGVVLLTEAFKTQVSGA